MAVIEVSSPAPDFSLLDQNSNRFSLSDLKAQKHVILVLNRGFV